MEALKTLLKQEGTFNPSDELIDMFLSQMSEINLKAKENIIEEGKVNQNVYLVKTGLFKLSYYNAGKELIMAFASPGTFFLSPISFYTGKTAFINIQSCKESTVMKISKERFDSLINESHDFARWMFNISMGQIFSLEMKTSLINGTAKERYLSLIKTRPDIIQAVPMKTVASYLGVTPSYICHIKQELAKK